MSMSATPLPEGRTENPTTGRSRQRLRTEKNAFRYLDEKLALPSLRRQKARARIRSAKQPIREARKVVCETLAPSTISACPDHSDVQELRVRLLRRDLVLCPEQDNWLCRLDIRIARREIGKQEFDREAVELLAMPNSIPVGARRAEHDFREASR